MDDFTRNELDRLLAARADTIARNVAEMDRLDCAIAGLRRSIAATPWERIDEQEQWRREEDAALAEANRRRVEDTR